MCVHARTVAFADKGVRNFLYGACAQVVIIIGMPGTHRAQMLIAICSLHAVKREILYLFLSHLMQGTHQYVWKVNKIPKLCTLIIENILLPNKLAIYQ